MQMVQVMDGLGQVVQFFDLVQGCKYLFYFSEGFDSIFLFGDGFVENMECMRSFFELGLIQDIDNDECFGGFDVCCIVD